MKKTLHLDGLECADCTAKMESIIEALPDINSAKINFATADLVIESDADMENVVRAVIPIIHRYAPRAVIKDQEPIKKHINQKRLAQILAGIVLFIAGMATAAPAASASLLFFLGAYVVSGGDILLRAFKNIIRGRVFDENLLMSIATIGALAIHAYPEAVAVMLFYQVGDLFSGYAVNKSRRSIAQLMDIRPDYANVQRNGQIEKVDPSEVKIGEIMIIRPGERAPLDGVIETGNSFLDTSALTGESLPREIGPGDEIISGCINMTGLITARVTTAFADSTVSRILDLVENAASKKSVAENFISKFARYYTPAVVGIAALLAAIPPLVIPEALFADWLYRALVFLVVSCPCALVISVPLSFFSGIGNASRNGVLVKGSNYLEALAHTEIVVFDKTGTLTEGVFNVQKVVPLTVNETKLLKIAATVESHSTHPIAISLMKAYAGEINPSETEDLHELPGLGVIAQMNGQRVAVGNARLMDQEEAVYPKETKTTPGTIVHVAIERNYAGYILIADEIKKDSAPAIQGLKKLGVNQIVMLTGDAAAIADAVAKDLDLDRVYSELLPQDKVELLEQLSAEKSPKGKLVFIGDGINDAPVLARADIGIAMGGLGADAAIEAADIVLMTDEPSKLVAALNISRRTLTIVKQNITFAIGVKMIVLLLGGMGLATMWEAVFADIGVTVLAVMNAIRILNGKV